MRAKLQPVFNMGGLNPRSGKFERQQTAWAHWCPACHTMHVIKFDSGWKLIDDWYNPTFEFSGVGIAVMYGKNPWMQAANNPACIYKIIFGNISYAGQSEKIAQKEFFCSIVPLPFWEIQDLMPKPSRLPVWATAARDWIQKFWLRCASKLP